MCTWLMHHWEVVSGGWIVPVGIWLYRRLGFRRLFLEGERGRSSTESRRPHRSRKRR